MSTERLYREGEIAAIFEAAADAQAASARVPREGLTLAELQRIGAEAGLAPEFVARAAARASGAVAAPRPTTHLGLPVGVARTVELPGACSDEGWDRLVADLRDTFGARGRVQQEGALRTWTNGNLQALVEPTEAGHRLRLRTRKGDAPTALATGLVGLALALALVVLAAASGEPIGLIGVVFAALSTALGVWTAARLPGWARTRAAQMEAVAARAAERAALQPALAAPVESAAPLRLDADDEAEPDDAHAARAPRRSRA